MSTNNSNHEIINAIKNNKKEAIDIFKNKNIDLMANDNEVLICAVKFNNANLIKLLLLEDFDISKTSHHIFFMAFENKSFESLYLILKDSRFKSNDITLNVFSYACMLKDKYIFDMLLNDPRVDINKSKSIPLLFSIIGGDIYIVKSILEHDNFNSEYLKTNNLKYITESIEHDDFELYKLLLSHITKDDTLIKNLNAIVLKESIKKKKYKLAKSLLKENNFILSISLNMFFINSYSQYDFEIFKLILNIKGFDASADLNKMIIYCMTLKKLNEVDLLWKRKEIKQNLKYHNFKLYKYLCIRDIKLKIENF